jgi:Putative F0F1-ATPase subunit Ca2+/Mg2+ transporter
MPKRPRLFVPFRARNDRNCQAVPLDIPVNRRPQTGADAATAGFVLIASMLICAAAGFGLGSLFGAAVPLGLVGLFAGLVVGFLLVYSRYRRL